MPRRAGFGHDERPLLAAILGAVGGGCAGVGWGWGGLSLGVVSLLLLAWYFVDFSRGRAP